MSNEESSELTADRQLVAASTGFQSIFNDDLNRAIETCQTLYHIPRSVLVFLRRLCVWVIFSQCRLVPVSSTGPRRRVLLASCTWDGGMRSYRRTLGDNLKCLADLRITL